MQLTQEQNGWTNQAFEFLSTTLAQSEIVLVYGCDIAPMVCNNAFVKKVYGVDARKPVCDTVYDAINDNEKFRLMYANIGELNQHNQPINADQFKQYHQYMVFPWALADKYDALPNLIIIDGHFKVASFLYSLICAPEGSRIIFNDYFDHPEYEMIRNYCPLESRQGAAAEFIVKKNYIMSDIAAMIAKYSVIP